MATLLRTRSPLLNVFDGLRRISVGVQQRSSSSDSEVTTVRKVIAVKKKWNKSTAIQRHLEDRMLFGDLLKTSVERKKDGTEKKASKAKSEPSEQVTTV